MIAWWIGLALADPAPIDTGAALALGMPRAHTAYDACDCVKIDWEVQGSDVRLEVGSLDIARFEHRIHDDRPHDLVLVTVAGAELLLEQAPCPFVRQAIDVYQLVLGSERTAFTDAGAVVADACGDIFAEVRAWDEEQRRRREEGVHVVTTGDVVLSKLKVDASKGTEDAVSGLRRSLAAARGSAGRCWGQGEVATDAAVTWKLAGKEGERPRIKASSSGVVAVDACFDDLAATVPLPKSKVKMKATFSPATAP